MARVRFAWWPVRPGAFALAAALLVTGCRATDHTRPSPPTMDESHAKTSRASFLLSGAAEPGARVVVTRLPTFASGEVPAPTFASGSNARFQLTVPLRAGIENVFLVSAVDEAGLGSTATEVDVDQVAPWPVRVDLALFDDRPALDGAGEATLRAQATLTLAEGASPAGQAVRFHIDGYTPAPDDLVATTDASGRATVAFAALPATGAGTVQASLPDGSLATDALPFVVRAGPATSATFGLSTSPTGEVSGDAVTVAAGVDLFAKVTATDAAGDPVAPGWSLTASPSDALVAGGVVRFERAGTYVVTAHVESAPGAELTPTATVTVLPGDAAEATTLSASLPGPATSGVALPYRLLLTDPTGAQVAADQVTIHLSDPLGTYSTTDRTVTFRTAGWQTATFHAESAGPTLTTTVSLDVRPGPAASLALTLAGTSTTLEAPYSAAPGELVTVGWTALDAAGNPLDDADVALSADAPTLLFGRTATAPSTPGTYAVVGRVRGSPVTGAAVLRVASQPPAALSLSCPTDVVAGLPFTCRATATDANGQPVDADVTYAADPPDGASIVDDELTLTAAGPIQVTATIAGTGVSDTREVEVAPAAPASLALALDPGSVAVGESAAVTTVATDAYGNEVPAEVVLSTDLPGAIAAAGRLTNVAHAGAFHVFAHLASSATVSAAADLTVTPGPSTSVSLQVSPASLEAGEAARLVAVARDASGNATTDAPAITVDGRAPDGLHARLDGASLTLFDAGAHVVTATVGDATDSALVQVTPSPDVVPPEVSVTVDRISPLVPPPQLYKPGETVKVTLHARDDRAIAGARVRVSGAAFGVLLDRQLALQPSKEVDQTLTFALPADRVGSFTVTAVASDTANHSVDAAPLTATSDFHFDRFALPGFPASAMARSVSIDPSLASPTGLGVVDGVVYTVSLASPNPPALSSRVVQVGAGGAVTTAWSLGDDLANPDGLVASPGGLLFMPALLAPGTGDSLSLMRLVAGVPAPQHYTTPPLVSARPDLTLAGPSLATQAMTLFAAARTSEADAPVQGLLYSMPAREGASATVDPTLSGGAEEVFTSELADLRPVATCLDNPATPTALFFTAEREGATPKVGLYELALTSGHVPEGAATAQTVFEEARDVAGGKIRYGACVAGPSGKLLFARWTEQADGSASAGRLSACAPATGCAPSDALVAADGVSLGAVDGLTRSGTSLFVAETSAGRLFQVVNAY